MGKCDAIGRYCIEENSVETFNCSTHCVGIYANIQWIALSNNEKMNDVQAEQPHFWTPRKWSRRQSVKADFKENFDNAATEMLNRLADLEREVKLLKSNNMKKLDYLENEVKVLKSSSVGEKGEEIDWKKYKELIAEYRKFKTNCVKHFRFSSAASSYAYRESNSFVLHQ